MSILDSIISETKDGPTIVRRNDDMSTINTTRRGWDKGEAAGMDSASAMRMADLALIDGRIAVAYVGDTAWHELGVQVAEAMTAEQAIELASLGDWIQKVPVMIQLDYETTMVVPGVYAVARYNRETKELTPFDGVSVGSRYEVLQNREVFSFVDSLLGEVGAHYETAGATAGGAKIFLTARLGRPVEIVTGDEIYSLIALTNAHDGTESVQVFGTEERIVCANTRRLAIAGKKGGLSIRHTGNMRQKIRQAKNAISAVQHGFQTTVQRAEAMVRTPLPRNYFSDVLNTAIEISGITDKQAATGADALAAALDVTEAERSLAAKSFARKIRRRESILNEILDIHESSTNTARGSLWGAYCAVTQYANHNMPYRGSDQKKAEGRLDSILGGRADLLNQAAYSVASSAL